MFSVSIRCADHVRQYSVSPRPGDGWEVRLQEDAELRLCVTQRDWHRVERTVARMKVEIDALLADGWRIDRCGVPGA